MWTAIIIAAVVIITVLIVIFRKKPTPEVSPTPSPSSVPSVTPTPSVTPIPPTHTTLYVYNSGMNTQDIISIRVDGKMVEGGEFPIKPGDNSTFITDQVGIELGVQVRFIGHPEGTASISLHTGDYSRCVNGPGAIVDFQDVPVNGTPINIDYDEVGC